MRQANRISTLLMGSIKTQFSSGFLHQILPKSCPKYEKYKCDKGSEGSPYYTGTCEYLQSAHFGAKVNVFFVRNFHRLYYPFVQLDGSNLCKFLGNLKILPSPPLNLRISPGTLYWKASRFSRSQLHLTAHYRRDGSN